VSALPTGGAPHAILRSRQKRQAIAGLRRALRLVDGNFNTPCPAFWLGISVPPGSDDDGFTLDVGVPTSEAENEDEAGVEIRGEYESAPGMARFCGGGCLYTRMSMSKPSWDRNEPWSALQIPGRRWGLALRGTNPTRAVGGGGHREEMSGGVTSTGYRRGAVLLAPPFLCMAHDRRRTTGSPTVSWARRVDHRRSRHTRFLRKFRTDRVWWKFEVGEEDREEQWRYGPFAEALKERCQARMRWRREGSAWPRVG
jgi:hypothetical protein